ncbi:hypothetical protein P3342_008276 [Pyrenophora teres f. teres]|nr:hypothetical protein P3342_008276 [Pyrenophora teres f. teres]
MGGVNRTGKAEHRGDEEDEAEDMDEEREELDEEMMDDIDEAIEVAEEEPGQEKAPSLRSCLRYRKRVWSFALHYLTTASPVEYDSPLVCALAVLGVKKDGWKGPEQYPPILSAVIKIARFMVVQKGLEMSGPEEDSGDETDNNLDDSAYESGPSQRRRPKGCLQLVQKMMDRFMVRGSHSPMQWMLDLRTYGLKIHYNTTTRGHVEWTNGDELLYKELHFSMAQFRGMLMFSSKAAPVPAVPWESIRDNPTDERPGWNFLKDHRTSMPVNGERWLFERVGESASIRSRFMKPGTQSGVDRQAVERYMDRVVEFREKLAVLMHMTGGQPARGPELLSGHRNIFIEDGMVVFVTRYHKGYKVSGDVKIIHRYLPREVGELVVWYMWLVLPFQQRLEALVWEKEAVSSHMWPADPSGRKWTTDRLREALKREPDRDGPEWTFAGYREMAIGISRRFCVDRLRSRQMRRENKEWAEEQAGDSIADEQAGHTSHVAGLVYARGIMEQSGAVADRRQQFRASSTDWHRFLGFQAGVDDQRRSSKRKSAGGSVAAAEENGRESAAEAHDRRGGQVPGGAGGSDQGDHSRRESRSGGDADGGRQELVVHVAGVGRAGRHDGGGSAVDRVAWRHGTAVQEAGDIVCRVAESASARRSSGGVGDARVGSWRGICNVLNRLRAMRQLDRIIIDECHIVLNRQYTFRKQMQQLGKLVAVETQMVMLTATLPPSEEDELFRRMHFERRQVRIFRAPTARSNIAYRVVRVERKRQEVEATVLAMVQQKVRKYKSGKIVVYGNSVPKVKGLAEKLKCHAYHHHAVGKASMLEEFMGGKQRVIVATSALGIGVDVPDIRCIVHIDWPFSVLDYAQESGRAGRDGERSEAIMMVQDGEQRAADDKQGEAEQRLVRAYVEGIDEAATDGCRKEEGGDRRRWRKRWRKGGGDGGEMEEEMEERWRKREEEMERAAATKKRQEEEEPAGV